MNVDSIALCGWWCRVKNLIARVALRRSDTSGAAALKPRAPRRRRTTAFFEIP